VKRKAFREDLFFRLNVVTIQLPPFEERKGTCRSWSHFLMKYNEQLKKNIQGFSEEALHLLCEYQFRAMSGNWRISSNGRQLPTAMSYSGCDWRTAVAAFAPPTFTADCQYGVSKSRLHVIGLFGKTVPYAPALPVSRKCYGAATASRMTRQNFRD